MSGLTEEMNDVKRVKIIEDKPSSPSIEVPEVPFLSIEIKDNKKEKKSLSNHNYEWNEGSIDTHNE